MNRYALRLKFSLKFCERKIGMVNCDNHKPKMISDEPLDLLKIVELIGRDVEKAVFFERQIS